MQEIIPYISIIIILALAYIKKSITKESFIVAFLIGTTLYKSGGWLFLTVLYAFFISSSILSKIKKDYKERLDKKYLKKGDKRDVFQIISSGGVPLGLSIINIFIPSPELQIAVIISLACANADTWASEIGVLSKGKCFSITKFKQMNKGISGGVSVLGLVFSLLGAFFIAIIAQIFEPNLTNLITITIFGSIGSLIDSIIGEKLQVLYYDETTKTNTENKPKNKYKKIKGIPFINNETVNLLSPMITTTIYLLIILLK